IYTDNYRSARVTDTYILKGDGVEVWEPRFTYRGFRYAQVTGLPEAPTEQTLVARVAHTASPWIGEFECSSDLIGEIQQNVRWGQRSNMHSVPTDCPQRDERLGWMGDALIFVETGCWNMDWQRFLEKWMNDIEDSQSEAGAFTDVAPVLGGGPASPGWGDAGVVAPYTTWLYYADERILESHYDAMVAWVEFMRERAPDNLYEREGYGDWIAVEGSPKKPIGAAYYYFSTKLVAEIAEVLGREGDAAAYSALAREIRDAFNAAYYDEATGQYPGGTQASYVLPLYMGLVPDDQRGRVEQNLLDKIAEDDYHPTTGFLGTAYLLPVLSEMGAHDVAARMITQETYPSWGYMVRQGATTIWELWNSDTAGPGMNSRNHFALGSVGRWFYEGLAGIRPDPQAPGFEHFEVAPEPGGGLTWAEASYDSPRGEIHSRWEINGESFELTVTVPPNASATVIVPGEDPAGEVDGADGVFEVPAGTWTFTSTWGA
ncbi:MAG: Bacterial alpha-L-rhamnosidase, partial [Armatimonadia bacterium]|nr:Bacterial alpha-L-rhamnosidase [Armatimonadia bacterium]